MNSASQATPWWLPVQGDLPSPAIVAAGTAGGLTPRLVRRSLRSDLAVLSSAFRNRNTISLKVAVEKLRAGESVLVFPEDEPVTSNMVMMGRPDVAALAIATGVPIVPVAERGSGASPQGGLVRSRQSRLVVGEPIDATRDRDLLEYDDKLEGWILREIVDKVMQAISALGGRPYVDQYQDDSESRFSLDPMKFVHDIQQYREQLREEREKVEQQAVAEAALADELDAAAQAEWDRAEQAAQRYAARSAALDEDMRKSRENE